MFGPHSLWLTRLQVWRTQGLKGSPGKREFGEDLGWVKLELT